MSLLLSVVFRTACTSTHQRLAVDALRFLRGEQADAWRELLLRFHKRYLEGAAAPDKEFKDFASHVLYAGQRPWGNAREAAREWYDKLLAALKERQWSDAAFAAGVLSHYLSDPLMPLNAAPAGAAAFVQPGVEWCVNRCYGQLQSILEEDFGGYPAIDVSGGGQWLEQLLLRGAGAAAAHAEAIVEHFDLAAALLDPEEALDQESQDRLAICLGSAVAVVAGVLEQALHEAAVKPPSSNTNPQGLVAALKSPFRLLSQHVEDQIAQRQLEEMLEELRLTGGVAESLPEEVREVRRLFGDERGSPQDASAAAGAHYGEGAPRRYRANRLWTDEPTIRPTSVATQLAGLAAQPHPGSRTSNDEPAIIKLDRPLNRANPIEDLPALERQIARRLRSAGIDTVGDLLAADSERLADRLRLRREEREQVALWQAQAELCCQIPGLLGHEARLLAAAGFRQLADLAGASPQQILSRLAAAGECQHGDRLLGGTQPPTLARVVQWQSQTAKSRQSRAA